MNGERHHGVGMCNDGSPDVHPASQIDQFPGKPWSASRRLPFGNELTFSCVGKRQ
jgi:hypothetical protein